MCLREGGGNPGCSSLCVLCVCVSSRSRVIHDFSPVKGVECTRAKTKVKCRVDDLIEADFSMGSSSSTSLRRAEDHGEGNGNGGSKRSFFGLS